MLSEYEEKPPPPPLRYESKPQEAQRLMELKPLPLEPRLDSAGYSYSSSSSIHSSTHGAPQPAKKKEKKTSYSFGKSRPSFSANAAGDGSQKGAF